MLNVNLFSKLGVAIFGLAAMARPDSLILVTSQTAQQATDSISWAQVGGDQTVVNASGTVHTAKGTAVTVTLAGANSILSKVCTASPCSWTGAGFTAGDTLLWTSDAGNGGNGPLKLSFSSGISGAGALLQADGPGPFTGKIEAFNGTTLLGSYTVASSTGKPVYIGVLDQTAPNLTSVVFSLTTASQGLVTDFAIDTVSLAVKSTSGSPAVQLSRTSVAFAPQLLKTKGALAGIAVTNTGTAPLAITSITATGDFGQTNGCGSSLPAGKSCEIYAYFDPSALGTRTGAITIRANAAGGSQTITLSGIGTEVKLSARSLTFPATSVGKASAAQILTITNVGSAALAISSITLAGSGAPDFAYSKTCGNSLGAGASCTISAKFQPKAKETFVGVLSINDNGGASPQQITLIGTGQ